VTPAPTAPPPSRGVIYLAAGGKSYLGELLTSLKSLRRHDPDLPVTVFSRFRLPASARCQHVDFRSAEHPLKQKVMVLRQSPYDQTLFLDTDTTVLGSLRPAFDFLTDHDFAVANMYVCDWTARPPRLISLVKPDDYNTGVLLYDKSPASLRFLDRWEQAVRGQDASDMWAGHNCDQDHFNRIVSAGAMQDCGVRFAALPNIVYNVRGLMVPELKRLGVWQNARILHHRTRAMKLRKALYSFTDWATAREILIKIADRSKAILRRPARAKS
jgi:hypothetical protein